MGFILSIDQGTTGTTAALIDSKKFSFIGKINQEHSQIYPSPGIVEHDLNEIWKNTESTVKNLLKKYDVNPIEIESIGITNQRETTCAFKRDGTPLTNAIVWQDRRTNSFCKTLKSKESLFKRKAGLPIDPYFSGTKMNWLLNNDQSVMSAMKNNNLLMGTIDTFLLYKLTHGKSFLTEPSNASRTLLMNLETTEWDDELLDILDINKLILPEIKKSFDSFGKTEGLSFLPDGIPITGILGDQQAALFGQAGFNKGDMKCTYGTGAFMLLNTGSEIKHSDNGLLTTVAYQDKNETIYALEGSCYIAGAAVQWLRDNLEIIKDSSDIESLALKVKNLSEMENVLMFPFFSGIGSPYWKPEAKASLIGLSRDTSKAHIARACLDGIALSIEDLIKAMRKDSNLAIKKLRVDGGAVENNLLMTIQATISSIDIIRPQVIETTAYGAALAAAIGAGLFSKEEITKLWRIDRSFSENNEEKPFYNKKRAQWNQYLKKAYL